MEKLTRILGGALLFLLPLTFTSCDLANGEVDNPIEPTPAQKPTYANDKERPLTFEAAKANVKVTLKFKSNAKPDYKKVEYSLDEGATWTALKRRSQAILLENVGDKVMFRGNNPTYNGDAQFVVESAVAGTRGSSSTDLKARLYGNILSMITSGNYSGLKKLVTENAAAFKNLFKGAPIDVQSENGENKLELPAEELASHCYEGTFAETLLTVAPELIAKILVEGCYVSTFEGCENLEEVFIGANAVESGTKIEDCVAGMLKNAGTDLEDGKTPTVKFTDDDGSTSSGSVTAEELAGVILQDAGDENTDWDAVTVDEKGNETPIEVDTDSNSATMDITYGEEDW